MNPRGEGARRRILAGTIALFILATTLSLPVRAESKRAPDFSLTDIDGNHLNLTVLRGKIFLIDFMYIGCASCEIARPVLQDVFGLHPGVMDGVSIDIYPTDTEAMLRTYRDQKGIPWHVARDTDGVQVRYVVPSVVRIFLVNQDGFVIFDKEGMGIGQEQSLRADMEAAIDEALSGTAPGFSLVDVDGDALNLTQLRGRIVLLEFMYIGNASAELARPVLRAAYAAHASLVTGLSIDVRPSDTRDALRSYRDAQGIPWRVARDTDNVSVRYAVTSVVHIVLVSQGGLVAFRQVGFSPGDETNLSAKLENAIAALIPPPPGDNLQIVSIFALAALAAVGSFFSPCSFPMFPGYMAVFLGLDTQSPEQKSRKRSVAYGVLSSFGIILVYGIIGIVVLAIGAAAAAIVPALQPIVGGVLIFMGVLMFTAVQFNFLVNPFRKVRQRLFPNWTPNTVQSTSGKLFSYGVGYGAAGFGCVAPPFIAAVLNATTLGGPLSGLTVLVVYALIVIAIMIAVTFVLATLGQTALKKINRYTETIKKVSAVVLIIAGIYLVYYWYAAWVAT